MSNLRSCISFSTLILILLTGHIIRHDVYEVAFYFLFHISFSLKTDYGVSPWGGRLHYFHLFSQ